MYFSNIVFVSVLKRKLRGLETSMSYPLQQRAIFASADAVSTTDDVAKKVSFAGFYKLIEHILPSDKGPHKRGTAFIRRWLPLIL